MFINQKIYERKKIHKLLLNSNTTNKIGHGNLVPIKWKNKKRNSKKKEENRKNPLKNNINSLEISFQMFSKILLLR